MVRLSMKNKMIKNLIVAIILLITNYVYAAPSIVANNYADATALSKEIDLPILVIFSSADCRFCDLLKNNMPVTEDLIICFVDYNNNKSLVKKYGVSLIPDSLLIDSKGKIVKRLKGFKDKKTYTDWLNQ